MPDAECVLQCCDGAGPKYTQTSQTEAAVSKASSPREDALLAATVRELLPINPTLCCFASNQEGSSKNLPGRLETSWVTRLRKSHLKINRQTIKSTNSLPGWSWEGAWLQLCATAPSCFPMLGMDICAENGALAQRAITCLYPLPQSVSGMQLAHPSLPPGCGLQPPVLLLGLALFCEHHKPQVILRFRQETLLQLLQWWDVWIPWESAVSCSTSVMGRVGTPRCKQHK